MLSIRVYCDDGDREKLRSCLRFCVIWSWMCFELMVVE